MFIGNPVQREAASEIGKAIAGLLEDCDAPTAKACLVALAFNTNLGIKEIANALSKVLDREQVQDLSWHLSQIYKEDPE